MNNLPRRSIWGILNEEKLVQMGDEARKAFIVERVKVFAFDGKLPANPCEVTVDYTVLDKSYSHRGHLIAVLVFTPTDGEPDVSFVDFGCKGNTTTA